MRSNEGAGVSEKKPRRLRVARIDKNYQRGIGRVLGDVAREFREGKIDGIHIVIVRPNNGGIDRIHVAMRDYQLVWAGNAMILDAMLEKD